MKVLHTLAAAAALALAAAGPAQADPRKNPTVEYMADAIIKGDGQAEIPSKIWYTKDRVRLDMAQDGQEMTMIIDKTTKKVSVLMTKQKLVQQEDLPDGDPLNPMSAGTWEVKEVAKEKIGDIETTKWSVKGKADDGRPFDGFVWTSKEDIQIRLEGESDEDGKKSKVTSELKNLKIGAVDPKLFEIPKDYKPAPKQ